MDAFNRILVTGVHGQVGQALMQTLPPHKEILAADRQLLDISQPEAIRRIVQEFQPDLIINPAAYTAVDKAESEADIAFAINAEAPRVFAEEASKLNALLVHYSTDYVFDGTAKRAYAEEDATHPLSVYGSTKLAGEKAIQSVGGKYVILRTSWVYSTHGKNFLRTILRLAGERSSLNVVSDQYGAPTWSHDIAEATVHMLQQWEPEKSGIYHMTNAGKTTWHGFATGIVERYQQLKAQYQWPPLKLAPTDIHAITTAQYPTPAKRPMNSCLDNSKLLHAFGIQMKDWQQALSQAIDNQHLLSA